MHIIGHCYGCLTLLDQLVQYVSRAGQYDSIILKLRYANRPILIPKLFSLYNFIVIDIIVIIL